MICLVETLALLTRGATDPSSGPPTVRIDIEVISTLISTPQHVHHPLPATPGEITPAWLTAILRQNGTLRGESVGAVDWRQIGIDWGFTGVVARLALQYTGTSAESSVPPSLIAKFPTAEAEVVSAYRAAQQRDPAAAARYLERSTREVRFYRELGGQTRLPVPRLYDGSVDEATGAVVLLLEDLIEATPGDVLRGCGIEQARAVIEALAALHGRWWGRRDPIIDWLPAWGGDPETRQARYNQRVAPFRERYGQHLPAAIVPLIERLQTACVALHDALQRTPLTVIHADMHLDNILFQPPGTEPAAVVLDWQSVARGPAVIDLVPMIYGSLSVADRRAASDALLDRYLARLADQGVAGLSLAQVQDACRLALLWQLITTVIWLGGLDLDRFTGRERALVDAAIGDGRLVAALIDTDAAALL